MGCGSVCCSVFYLFIHLFFYIKDNEISTHVLFYIQSPCVCGFVNFDICSHRHTVAYSYVCVCFLFIYFIYLLFILY